jgi:hypothetical protein
MRVIEARLASGQIRDVLMTKFGKVEKIRCSGFLFRIVRFWQFQTQTEEGAKIKDLKIQGEFKNGKGRQGTNKRNSRQKNEVAKIGWSNFLITDRVRLVFEI